MDTLNFATWNILGDDLDRRSRLQLVSQEIVDLDFVAIQEIVIDPETGVNTALQLGQLTGYEVASCISGEVKNLVTGQIQSTCILSKLEIVEKDMFVNAPTNLEAVNSQEYQKYAAAILRAPNNRMIFVCSVHFPWGAQNEKRRLEHSLHLDRQIDEIMTKLPKDSIAILAGDFNCTPDSDSIRFLKGGSVYAGESTFWVDAWAERGVGPGYTFDPSINNSNLNETAYRSGILDPTLMPSRRLDYILIKGWVHGKIGSPLSANLIGDRLASTDKFGSDHLGVKVSIWNP